jgi:peptidoglycan/LPS O-acetylase OafA/YrhL
MKFSVLPVALYLYSGPLLIAVVFAYVTYHVFQDWRRRRRRTRYSESSEQGEGRHEP